MTASSDSGGRVSLTEATYAITADTGELGQQARLLCASIASNCPQSTIVTFVPSGSWEEMDECLKASLSSNSTVVRGEIPISGYPISALQQALIEAVNLDVDSEYYVALDTDMVMMNPLTVPDSGAEVYARPATLGAEYWASEASEDEWTEVYDHFDLPMPERSTKTVLDGRATYPYYNAGVVVTTDEGFPEEWLKVTRETLVDDVLPSGETFYNDQVALPIAAANRGIEVETLSVNQNFPFGASLWCPSDVEMLHYGRLNRLRRLLPLQRRHELKRHGWEGGRPSVGDLLGNVLVLLSFHSSSFISYNMRERLRAMFKALIPNQLVEKG